MKKQDSNKETKNTIQKNDKYSTEFGKSEMLEYEHRSKQIDRDEENTAY